MDVSNTLLKSFKPNALRVLENELDIDAQRLSLINSTQKHL